MTDFMSVLGFCSCNGKGWTEIDQFGNPSETIWPATVAIIVELCLEKKSAMASSAAAAEGVSSTVKARFCRMRHSHSLTIQ